MLAGPSGELTLPAARVDDPRLESEMRFVNCKTTGDAEGRLQLEIDYNGETVAMYPEQILAAFLGIQIITGVWLAMHYEPSATGAFTSVEKIMRDVKCASGQLRSAPDGVSDIA